MMNIVIFYDWRTINKQILLQGEKENSVTNLMIGFIYSYLFVISNHIAIIGKTSFGMNLLPTTYSFYGPQSFVK